MNTEICVRNTEKNHDIPYVLRYMQYKSFFGLKRAQKHQQGFEVKKIATTDCNNSDINLERCNDRF